jgi:hypothetical protein
VLFAAWTASRRSRKRSHPVSPVAVQPVAVDARSCMCMS